MSIVFYLNYVYYRMVTVNFQLFNLLDVEG